MTEALGALAAALSAAQGEMQNAAFNKKNPHFKSSYADLSAIRDAVTPALAKHGLAVTQTLDWRDGAAFLVTQLVHKDGGKIDGCYPLPPNHGDPQKFGSALTYARRYSLAALCNIASEEDDDGNAASAPTRGGKPAAVATVTADPAPPPPATFADDVAAWTADDASAWAETVARGLEGYTLKALDTWEVRPETDKKMDRLMELDREAWKGLKAKMATRRKALEQKAAA